MMLPHYFKCWHEERKQLYEVAQLDNLNCCVTTYPQLQSTITENFQVNQPETFSFKDIILLPFTGRYTSDGQRIYLGDILWGEHKKIPLKCYSVVQFSPFQSVCRPSRIEDGEIHSLVVYYYPPISYYAGNLFTGFINIRNEPPEKLEKLNRLFETISSRLYNGIIYQNMYKLMKYD